MKIAIGADHGGYFLKEEIKAFLLKNGHVVEYVGTYSPESTDYNEYATSVAEGVRDGAFERGILICGTGVGMSIHCR